MFYYRLPTVCVIAISDVNELTEFLLLESWEWAFTSGAYPHVLRVRHKSYFGQPIGRIILYLPSDCSAWLE